MLLELGTPSGRGKPIAPAPLRQAHLVAAPMLVALVVLGAALFWLADTLAALTAIAVTVPFLILGMWPLFVSLRLRIKEKQEIALAVHRAKARARSGDGAGSELWTKQGAAALTGGDRLALAEVSVEFVTSKNEMGESRQAAFIPPHPVFLAANAAGMGRKNVEFDDDAFGRVVSRISASLRSELQSRGWSPVQTSEILSAESYARFTALPIGEARDIRQINLAATDTGRVRTMRVVPTADGSVISGPAGSSEADARRALLDELGADALLRVVIRVGVYQGKASFEEGSKILLTTPEGDATLTARHSLLSDLDVLGEDATDGQLIVSEDAYLTAVENTAPVFIRQAIDTLER
eukprot:g6025.t1